MTFYCTYCGHGIETPAVSISVMPCPKCKANVNVPSYSSHRPDASPPIQATPSQNVEQTLSSNQELRGWIRRLFLSLLLLCLSIGAITGIIALLSQEIGDIKILILMTTLSLGVYSVTGLCCLAISELPPWKWFGRIGVMLSIIAALFAIATNWIDLGFSDVRIVVKARAAALIVAIAFAHASLLMRISLHSISTRVVRWLTLSCIAMLASVFVYFAMEPKVIVDIWPILGVLGIMSVLGTLATVILRFVAPTQHG